MEILSAEVKPTLLRRPIPAPHIEPADTSLPRVLGVGTANPGTRYNQEDIAELFGKTSPRIMKLFKNSHIKSRYLYLPKCGEDGMIKQENSDELRKKHLHGALEMGEAAIQRCLGEQNIRVTDVDSLTCVSSTGFLCPGISAHITKRLGFRNDVRRVDILGMGCSAGMNGLQCTTSYARSNPGKKALMLAVEVCSAAYFVDESVSTAIVNSLFGDGAAAMLLEAQVGGDQVGGPQIVDFESETVVENIDALRYDLVNGMLSFYLDRDIPYVIGTNVHKPVERLLARHNLKRRQIRHWIIHSGGKKVIDSIKYNINLTTHDLRHTLDVLEEYGNMSSCSFMFSYDRLCKEGDIQKGDMGITIAMGPGVSIETALLRW